MPVLERSRKLSMRLRSEISPILGMLKQGAVTALDPLLRRVLGHQLSQVHADDPQTEGELNPPTVPEAPSSPIPTIKAKRKRLGIEDGLFDEFLRFESTIFGEDSIMAVDDPYLIRYGEYRYVLDSLKPTSGEIILDVGCEFNIFMLFLASRGARILGVDLSPKVGDVINARMQQAESVLGRKLDISFREEDGTAMTLPSNSVDKVMAVSAIEHFFSDQGHGDWLAMESMTRILKPGGLAVITVPMSNGGLFHESSTGDKDFGYPYRQYTPEVLMERIGKHAHLELIDLSYLAQTTPDPRYNDFHFHTFWFHTLTNDQRRQWGWANAILSKTFNPIVTQKEGESCLQTLNTALLTFRKKSRRVKSGNKTQIPHQ